MRLGGSRKYDPPTGSEAETQPGSHGRVLRNRLGIRRKSEMDRVEYEALLRMQEQYVHRITSDTRFSTVLVCEMHRSWLGDIYSWAGEFRTVELSKSGFRWPPARLVDRNMAEFEAKTLAVHTPCREAPLQEVAWRMAVVHAEFLLIHPFRDGNGRVARWLAALMALQSGFPTPKFQFEGRGGKKRAQDYLKAVREGYLQNYDRLTGFFRDAIDRRLEEPE